MVKYSLILLLYLDSVDVPVQQNFQISKSNTIGGKYSYLSQGLAVL